MSGMESRESGELWLMIGEAVEKEVGARLREITDRIAALEAQVADEAPKKHQIPPGSGDAPMKRQISPGSGFADIESRSHTLSLEDVVEESANEWTYQMQNSIWDAALLIGIPAVGGAGSAFLVIGLTCNILLQGIFCYVIYNSFLQLQMLPRVEDAWEWRESYGHQFSNMLTATRTSLVRQMCDGKGMALTTSNVQHRLVTSIRTYTETKPLGIPLGAMLCTVVLISWALLICQEMGGLRGFAAAVLTMPQASDTKFHSAEGRPALTSCSLRRKCCMAVIIFSRFAIAMCLLVCGSIWLANTLSIVELVLNAAALSFIMSFDELIFETLAPMPARVLIKDMAPLAMPRVAEYRGLTLSAPVNLVSTLIVVSCIVGLRVLPNLATMGDITEAICGGFKDFVVSDTAVDLLIATRTTNPFAGLQSKSFPRQAVRDLVTVGEIREVDKVFNLARFDTFRSMLELPINEIVDVFANQVLANKCEDYAFSGPVALHTIKATLRNDLGADVETCADAADYCPGNSRLLRMVCPMTCGCDDPHSGLYKNALNEGCPTDLCVATPRYAGRLSSIPCADYSVSELLGIPGWGKVVVQFTDVWMKNQPNFRGLYEEALPVLLAHGCGALDLVNARLKTMLCASTKQFGSIRPYCPSSCDCADNFAPDCPTQCHEELP